MVCSQGTQILLLQKNTDGVPSRSPNSAAHICLEEEGLCVLSVTPSMRSGYHVIHSYYMIK